jgi:hypothetical protein
MSYIFFFKKILTAINDMNIAYIMMRVQRWGCLKGIIRPVRIFASRYENGKAQ